MDIVLPRALVGDTDGSFSYKATSQLRVTGGFTGILDYISDVGSPAISVAPQIIP